MQGEGHDPQDESMRQDRNPGNGVRGRMSVLVEAHLAGIGVQDEVSGVPWHEPQQLGNAVNQRGEDASARNVARVPRTKPVALCNLALAAQQEIHFYTLGAQSKTSMGRNANVRPGTITQVPCAMGHCGPMVISAPGPTLPVQTQTQQHVHAPGPCW